LIAVFRRRERAAARSAEVVPGYADLIEIGGGASATVYRATEVETGRNVALKILKLETIQPHLVETFGQEIQTLAKVSDHPNIVTLYRPLSTPDGRPALVLELCRESLAQQIRRHGPLDSRQTVRVGIKIAGALETAHRNGFLHRDMKPQNILVTQFDEPALADFGVAALQASAQATAGVLGFTTVHAAPEILEGRELSPATDIYGLASSLYQLLTGLAPFAAFENEAPAAVILRILRDPVRPVRSSAVPLELSDLLEAALAKSPDGRPPTAARFAEALRDIEEACSWPQTSYVAWGAEPARREPDRVAVPSSLPLLSQPPPPPPVPARPAPVPRPASSVQSPLVSVPPPPVPAPPARTSDRPLPGQAAPPPDPLLSESQMPEDSPAPALRLHKPPAPEPMSTDSGPAQPPSFWLPPPPAPRPGPTLLRPESAARNVVTPGETTRGQPSRPLNQRSDRMPPLTTPPAPSDPDQTKAARTEAAEPHPVFVDPDRDAAFAASAGASRAVGTESVYEATILPPSGRRVGGRQAIEPPDSAGWHRGLTELPPAAMAGIGAAALVVILALLLIAGVL
jgi:serine/threonine protein kinase